MNPETKTLIVIVLRQLAPLLGGAGLFSDNDLEKIAGGLILVGSIAYHAYQRHQGKKDTIKISAQPPYAMSLLSDQAPAFDVRTLSAGDPPPLRMTLAQQGDAEVAKILSDKPSKFTVGAYTDGKGVNGGVSFNRTWKNGFGATAYIKGWYHDAAVIPGGPASGVRVGAEGEYKFGQ